MTEISRRSLIAAAAFGGVAALSPALRAAEKPAQAVPESAETFDVVVAGGGAAGCMAARTAAKAGKKVLLVQSMPMLGGSSAISSGWIRACKTKWHEASSIEDTEKAYEEDIVAYGKGSRNPKKAAMIAREAGAFVNELFAIGVEFTDEEDRTNGGEKLRVVKTKGAGGALMQKLAEAVKKDPGITVRTKTSLVDVILDAEGKKVVGAKIAAGRKELVVRTKAVVIATGGLGAIRR